MSRMMTALLLALALATGGSCQPGVKAFIGGTWRQVPLQLNCSVVAANPPQRTANCKVINLLTIPLCAHLICHPRPAGACSQPDYGLWWLTGVTPTTTTTSDCAWNVKSTPGRCHSPNPIQPGQSWDFGFMTSYKGPIKITLPPWNVATSQTVDGNC